MKNKSSCSHCTVLVFLFPQLTNSKEKMEKNMRMHSSFCLQEQFIRAISNTDLFYSYILWGLVGTFYFLPSCVPGVLFPSRAPPEPVFFPTAVSLRPHEHWPVPPPAPHPLLRWVCISACVVPSVFLGSSVRLLCSHACSWVLMGSLCSWFVPNGFLLLSMVFVLLWDFTCCRPFCYFWFCTLAIRIKAHFSVLYLSASVFILCLDPFFALTWQRAQH